MTTIGVGIIGAGAISGAHLDALSSLPGAEAVCIADRDQERARERAQEYGIPKVVGDYRQLVAAEEVEAVVVAIPTAFHAQASLAALERGKHVLCEKPMARSVEDCLQMMSTAREGERILQIAFVRRFDPAWLKVRELVQSGRVGRPCLWRRIVAGAAPQPPTYGEWYTDSRYSDGPLMENGSHDLDFVCHTFGEPEAVTASTRRFGQLGDVDDTANLVIDFAGGDQLLFSWSWALPPGASGFGGLDVVGPKGLIEEPVRLEGKEYAARVVLDGGETEEHPFTLDRSEQWYTAQMANFIASIRGEEEPAADGEAGLRVQKIMDAAEESSNTGRRVEL